MQEPGEYVKGGIAYCSLHRARLVPYRVSGSFLLTTYEPNYLTARRQCFPCSQWIETDKNATIEAFYCEECERLQVAWIAANP